MARLVLTGASGYIGKRLLEMARADGHQLVVLGREAPGDGVSFYKWTLGENPPAEALANAQAVIHLAHSWRADTQSGENLNARASETLARAALAAGVPRFVFASTNSARPNALNAYGRMKHDMEGRLAALPGARGRVVSARIALVYGGVPAGQYAMMRAITRLAPVLPMIGLDRQVQPIHLDEVCTALLTLALHAELANPHYVVASDKPVRFGQWLRMLRKVQTGKGLVFIPLPFRLMLLVCDITRWIPFLPTVDRERVLGLAAALPMPSADSLEALGLVPADPFTRLMQDEKRDTSGEAHALLRYLAAKRVTPRMVDDLAAGLARARLSPLGLPPILLRYPGLIALVEPPANRHANRLAQGLHLAAQVIEAHDGPQAKRGGLLRAAFLIFLDLLTLPLRLLTARRYQ